MKPTDLPWLEFVPEHWILRPNRALMRRRKVLVGPRFSEYPLLSLTKKGVIVRDVESGKGKFSADMSTFQEVRDGDLVFCLFDVPETPRTVGLSRFDGMITGAYTVFECSDPVLAAFLDLFYRAMDDRKLLSPLYSGLRNTIPPPRLLGAKTPIPPTDEQDAIVRFLDYADRRIQRYLRGKQKLVKLLDEQRQIITYAAVTRGLDPMARLKPSGVDWLGQIPEHWEVRRIRSCLTDSRAGVWGSDPTDDNVDEHVTCVRVADFDMAHLRVGEAKLTIRAVPPSAQAPRRLERGDILLEKSGGGEAEPVGRVVMFDLGISAISSNFITRLRADKRVLEPAFLLNVLASMQATRRNVPCIKQTTGIQNLDEHQYLSLEIAVPPIQEQRLLLAELDDAVSRVTLGVARVLSEMELVREYRTSLTADLATGKLDVRKAANSLPPDLDGPGDWEVEIEDGGTEVDPRADETEASLEVAEV